MSPFAENDPGDGHGCEESSADAGLWAAGRMKLLSTNTVVVTAYVQPAHRGIRPDAVMAPRPPRRQWGSLTAPYGASQGSESELVLLSPSGCIDRVSDANAHCGTECDPGPHFSSGRSHCGADADAYGRPPTHVSSVHVLQTLPPDLSRVGSGHLACLWSRKQRLACWL